ILFIHDERITDRINNRYDFRKFAEFLINYAYEHAPEITQLDWNIKVQEESLQSNKYSLYLPQVALQGNLDQTIGRYGTRVPDETFQAIGIDPYQPTWNIGINASLPIFQGNLRKRKIEKDKILLSQLEVNRDLLKQNFATNIRISLENLGNSYNNILLNQQAETSSEQFLRIVQELYREGASNIVTLLDAQNNALSAQLGLVFARYQFLIDAITIERLYNNIYLLSSNEDKEAFINEFLVYLTKKENNE
ncbi:MAG: TolC family protein, partial [Bacteroidota bacterium]